jgi:hypothetical protein
MHRVRVLVRIRGELWLCNSYGLGSRGVARVGWG